MKTRKTDPLPQMQEMIDSSLLALLTIPREPLVPDPFSVAQRDALLQIFSLYTLSKNEAVAAAASELWDRILSGPLGARWHKEK